MPAKNRDDLIAVTQKEWEKLSILLQGIGEEEAMWRDPAEQCSIRDIITHRTHWLNLLFDWYTRGKAGETVETPAPGYKWNQLKAYNAMIRADHQTISWQQACGDLEQAHADFRVFLQSHDEETLYTPKLYAWMRNWTLGRWAEAQGPSHYRSACKVIKAMLKAQRASKGAH